MLSAVMTRLCRGDLALDRLAEEPQPVVSDAARPGAGRASVSTWKPLQIPSTGQTLGGADPHGVHDRREPGDGPGPQVVAMGEAPRDDDGVVAGKRVVPRARRARPLAPRRESASTTSCSQFDPGRRRRPRHRSRPCGRSWSVGACDGVTTAARWMTGLASSRWASCSAVACGRGRIGGLDDEPEDALPTLTRRRRRSRGAGRARSIVAALRIGDARSRAATSTCAANLTQAPHQSAKDRPADPLVGRT